MSQDIRRYCDERQNEDIVLQVVLLGKRLNQNLGQTLVIVEELKHGQKHRRCLNRSVTPRVLRLGRKELLQVHSLLSE